jgi:hypothetical protein
MTVEKHNLPIPEQFEIQGFTIKVQHDKTLIRDDDAFGNFRPRDNMISLQVPDNANWPPKERIEQTFCHELTHVILYYMNNKLWKDEDFVDNFASLLHQTLITMVYPKETTP